MMDFDHREKYLKEHIKQNIMAVLRKANSHSVDIRRFIKKHQGEKQIRALFLSKLPSDH